ncbi:MAG TPA: lysine transporter LysE [Gammaproteobacteria bacterium]|nr:lysine transporter LysE [Gammaproteobacteria bacterium]HRF42863.1 LysE family translocator [Candidatus Competibacteraceae bacterium]
MPPESFSFAPWVALALFTFTTSITPGPNNLMLTVTGAQFGLRATVPAMAGILAGMSVLIGLAGAGVATLLLAVPGLEPALRTVGLGYLLWLAWKLCAPSAQLDSRAIHRPLTTTEAVLFQFANPKAWMMAITAATTFLPGLLPATSGDQATATFAVALCFMLVGGPCIACWAILGAALQNQLQQGSRLRQFNTFMGLLLAATALGMAWV